MDEDPMLMWFLQHIKNLVQQYELSTHHRVQLAIMPNEDDARVFEWDGDRFSDRGYRHIDIV